MRWSQSSCITHVCAASALLLAFAGCASRQQTPAPAAQAAPAQTSTPAAQADPPQNAQQSEFEANFAKALRESAPKVRSCFDEGKKKNPHLGGLFSATVDIEGDGRISAAVLDPSTTLKDASVLKCMLGVVKGIGTIPNPTASASRVTYAMQFASEPAAPTTAPAGSTTPQIAPSKPQSDLQRAPEQPTAAR